MAVENFEIKSDVFWMYSPPPRPHLSADHHWGRISFWRSLLLELSTASLDPRVRSAFFLPLPLSHHDDLYGTCKVPSWPHCSSNCAFADCTNVWSEAAQRKLFRLAAPWAILKANIQVIFSQMTHNSSFTYGKCPVKLWADTRSVRCNT